MLLRAVDVTPEAAGAFVVTALARSAEALRAGALVTIDETARRTRALPLPS